MQQRKFVISIQDFMIVFVFLLSIFLHTEFSETFYLFSFRKVFILISVLVFLYKVNLGNNVFFLILMLGQVLFFVVGHLVSDDYYLESDTIYAFFLYCVPFVFDSKRFSEWTKRGVRFGFLTAVLLLYAWAYMGMFQFWNANCIAYLYFGGINLYLFLGCFKKESDKEGIWSKVIFLILYLYSIFLLLQTESRNVVLAQAVVLLLVLFNKIMQKKYLYYLISIFATCYAAISLYLNEYINRNSRMFEFFLRISDEFFGKDTVFDGRLDLQRATLKLVEEHFLIGNGHTLYSMGIAPHNNYLVLVYSVGLVGTIICFIFIMRVLVMAYQNYMSGDEISYVCAAILMGFLIQTGAESFLFGNNILVIMPYFFMGVIISKNRRLKREYQKNLYMD